MPQKLTLPINIMKMTAGYLNQKYLKQFGYNHYGIDAISTNASTQINALGAGVVFACGQDGAALVGPSSRLGNCVVVVYKDVQCNDGKIRDLACRIFHLDKITCKAGDKVQAGTVIGTYGNTGANSTGAHLHIEFDTDIKYPQYAFGIAGSGNVIKKGTVNTTVNPSKVWYTGKGQRITGWGNGWTVDADMNIPNMQPDTSELDALRAENNNLKTTIAAMKADYKIIFDRAAKYK